MNKSLIPVCRDNGDNHHDRYFFQELERIDLCLQRYADHYREELEAHVLEGFLLDKDAIYQATANPVGAPHWMRNKVANEHTLFQATGSGGRLASLIERFELTPFEADILILGLLTHVDNRYCSLFSALQRSNEKHFPSFELSLALLGKPSWGDQDSILSLLPHSPLLKHQLIMLKSHGRYEGWGQHIYQTSIGVYQYLTGNWYVSPSLALCAQWYPQSANMALYAPSQAICALQVQGQDVEDPIYPVIMLEGAIGSGRLAAIRAAAATLGHSVLSLDMAKLPHDMDQVRQVLGEALREVRMRDAVLAVYVSAQQNEESLSLSFDWGEYLPLPGLRMVMLCDRQIGHISLPGVPQLVVAMTSLTRMEKELLLGSSLDAQFTVGIDTETFCRRFSFNHLTLPLILQEAKYYRYLRDASDLVRAEDLNQAFRLHARKDFGKLAQRKEPKRTFDDLVVSDELKIQLTEILMAAKHRDAVLELGFVNKVGYGTGVSALFCGHSGTGKTMAAEVIASQLGVDLIKVDLSTVVNKYIGETEKNLSRIFDLAEADAGVLFFDEADALFGKRTAVSDSKDRNANIGVAYLLQRLENHPGLVILATNHRNHLDDAFSRRFTFITRFDFPDATLREEMWRRIWPTQITLSDEIDFAALAKSAELTGANIRNIALMATWLAVEDCMSMIHASHINLAMKREMEKVGRVVI